MSTRTASAQTASVAYPVLTPDNVGHISHLTTMGAIEATTVLRLSPPDSKLMAVGRETGINLYPTTLAAEQPNSTQHFETDSPITTLAFSANGAFLAASMRNGSISVWNIQTGQQHIMRTEGSLVSALAFSRDANSLAAGEHNGTLYIWNLQASAPPVVLSGQESDVAFMGFAGDGKTLLSTDQGYTEAGPLLYQWDITFATLLSRLAICSGTNEAACSAGLSSIQADGGGSGQRNAVHVEGTPALSADGNTLAWQTRQNIILWDVKTEQVKAALTGACMSSPVFSPDDSQLTCPIDNSTFAIWNLAKPGSKQSKEPSRSIAFSNGWIIDYLLAPANGTSHLHLLQKNPQDGWTVWQEGMAQPRQMLGDAAYLLLGNDGAILGKTGEYGGAGLWDVRNGAPRVLIPNVRLEDYAPPGVDIGAGVFSPDGQHLALREDLQTVVFDVKTGKPHAVIHAYLEGRTAFSADGLMLINYALGDEVIRRWDIALDKVQAVVYPQGLVALRHSEETAVANGYDWVELSGDGSRLVGLLGDPQQGLRVAVWDTVNGQKLKAFSLEPNHLPLNNAHSAVGQQLALTADGSTLAVSDKAGSQMTLWNLTSGKPGMVLSAGGLVDAVAFNHAGSLLAAITESPGVAATEMATQAMPHATGTQAPIVKMLVVWDMATGHQLLSLADAFYTSNPDSGVFVPAFHPDLAFSHDDRLLFIGGDSPGAVQVWGIKE